MKSRVASSVGAPLAVAFMAGHWVGGEADDLLEEVWTAPEGDSMLGMWRYVAKGQARVLEKDGSKQEFRFRRR